MTSLIVLLPSSDRATSQDWDSTQFPFALLGRKDEALEVGSAVPNALPRAETTVLIVAACDTLLLHANLPPVTGARLQRSAR